MADSFVIGKGNDGVAIRRNLTNADGSYVDLSGGAVVFRLWSFSDPTAVKISAGPCVINDAATGDVSYAFSAADLNTPGHYLGQFKFTNASAKVRHFPVLPSGADAYIEFEVVDTP